MDSDKFDMLSAQLASMGMSFCVFLFVAGWHAQATIVSVSLLR